MTNIWKFETRHTSPSLTEDAAYPGAPLVCHCDILNGTEVRDAGFYEGRPRKRPFPVAQLILTLETYDADYFIWEGRLFASERLRRAMALDPSVVRFFEVDASRSAPLPRSKNYQIMEPTVVEDVSDPEKSDYGVLPWGTDAYLNMLMDGSIGNPVKPENRAEFASTFKSSYERLRAKLDMELSPIEAHSIVMRADAAPAHELFYDSFFRLHLMCTEAFAVRVLKAGCTGVRFIDPSRLEVGTKRRYRTLRGIEVHVKWDHVNKVEITKLIRSVK
jgi:hypothetical protein